MVKTNKNLNAELYSTDLFELWANLENLIPAEAYVIKKYFNDTSKSVLEAGTGGGRIAFQIEAMGFNSITAYDYVPKMIAHSKSLAEEKKSNIKFLVSDATNLEAYNSDSYDYLVYLQQVLCFIDKKEAFTDALKEAHRVTKKDGIIIFSFLDFDSKFYNPILSFLVNLFGKLRGEKTSKQQIPWLMLNHKFNWKLFNRDQPKNYWIKKDEIISELKTIGFTILESKNENQFFTETEKREGMLYVVCQK